MFDFRINIPTHTVKSTKSKNQISPMISPKKSGSPVALFAAKISPIFL